MKKRKPPEQVAVISRLKEARDRAIDRARVIVAVRDGTWERIGGTPRQAAHRSFNSNRGGPRELMPRLRKEQRVKGRPPNYLREDVKAELDARCNIVVARDGKPGSEAYRVLTLPIDPLTGVPARIAPHTLEQVDQREILNSRAGYSYKRRYLASFDRTSLDSTHEEPQHYLLWETARPLPHHVNVQLGNRVAVHLAIARHREAYRDLVDLDWQPPTAAVHRQYLHDHNLMQYAEAWDLAAWFRIAFGEEL